MSKPRNAFWRPKPHFVIMAVLFVGAAVAAVLMLPGENERVAMLERDGSNSAALRILEARFNSGDRRQRTLYQLQRLYEEFGELAKARRTLEMLAERRPRDAYVQRQLAHFYKATQDGEAYISALRRQLSIRYSEPACRDLIGILRRNGNYEQEQRTIESCAKAGYRRPDDLIRLAFLAASDGNLVQTAELLSAVDDRRKLAKDRQQLMLFEALLRTNKPEDARRRGSRWLKGADDDELALTLIHGLSRQKRYDLAIELARDVSKPGDSVALTVAELMLDQEQDVAARSYLRGWLEKAKFEQAGVAERFVVAALDAEDFELALAGARKYGIERLPAYATAAMAEAAAASRNEPLFAQLIGQMGDGALGANPLLAAAVAVQNNDRKGARRLLAEVDINKLDGWRFGLLQEIKKGLTRSGSKGRRERSRRRRR